MRIYEDQPWPIPSKKSILPKALGIALMEVGGAAGVVGLKAIHG